MIYKPDGGRDRPENVLYLIVDHVHNFTHLLEEEEGMVIAIKYSKSGIINSF